MSAIRPLGDRLVVERVEDPPQTSGALHIPESAREKPLYGEVIAVGKGKTTRRGRSIPLDVRVGDRVLFGQYAGTDVKLDGAEYVVLRETDVLGYVP